MRSKPPLAFTLIEVIVASTLSLLLIGLLASLLVPGMQATLKGSAQADLGEQAMVLGACLNSDLQGTTAGGLSVNSGTSACNLSIQPVLNVLGDGTLQWDTTYLAYYWDSTSANVVRRQWSGQPGLSVTPTASAAVAPAVADLAKIASLPARALASGVTALQFSASPGSLTVSCTLTRSTSNGPQTYSLNKTMCLRNHG